MFDWNDLRYFLAVARAQTLAGAATMLKANPTTVGRRVQAFEEHVGARLFDRTPEGFLLTQAGADLLPYAEGVERAAAAVERSVVGADARLSGRVRLATTETLATRFIAPHLPRLHEAHPELTLDVTCALRAVDLGRREADIALRLTRPRELDVIARPLAQIDLALYAARSYVDSHGAVNGEGLAGHRVVLFADTPAFAIENGWLLPRAEGARIALRSDSVSAIFSAALAGVGVALLPRVIADQEPSLVRFDAASAPAPRTVWQGVHRDLGKNARVAAVVSFLAECVARS